MVNLITKHIDIWTAAQTQKANGGRGRGKKSNGQSPHGIKKLRELILELAVRGKLEPQDPNNEPASILLEKMAAEKARLIEEGKIKRKKQLPEITEDEKPFDLPHGWEWARIGDVGHDWGQKKPDNEFTYVEVSGIDNVAGIVKSPNRLTAAEAPSRARKIVKVGTVIYSTVRPYLQNICVIDQEYSPEPIASTAFAILHPFQQMPGKFFTSYLRSPVFVSYVESVQTGIAYPAINDKQFFGGVIPIPPIVEQHRIVDKVDELMALCDHLEKHQTASNAAHQTLVETLLATLTSAANQDEFTEAWKRINNHFDTLFTTEQRIDQLKHTILQLAVMGKLVPQDPNEAPASVLLETIAKEKTQLVKDGKIKKQQPLLEISEDEKPFDLPHGWEWTRLGDVIEFVNGFAFKSGDFSVSGVGIVKIGDIQNGEITAASMSRVDEAVVAVLDDSLRVNKGDMLIAMSGATTGKLGFNTTNEVFYINQRVGKISPYCLYAKYLYYPLTTKIAENLAKAMGSAIPNLSTAQIKNIVFALPPLAEQHRIVAKVDELMALCYILQERLNDAQSTRVQLADAIVEQAVA